MIPERPPVGSAALPDGAQYWTPKPSDIDEEGLGFFRDTWRITSVTLADARMVIAEEASIVEVLDQLAQDVGHFETLARVAEDGALDDPAYELSSHEREALSRVASDVPPELGGLEVGVAGLVHALAAIRAYPAASCRYHPDGTWTDAPVVLVAIDQRRAQVLQPLVELTGCTFTLDANRGELLVVRGQSIARTMDLAQAIIDHRDDFKRPPSTRPKRSKTRWSADTLF